MNGLYSVMKVACDAIWLEQTLGAGQQELLIASSRDRVVEGEIFSQMQAGRCDPQIEITNCILTK